MATETTTENTSRQAPEICHPFVLGTRYFWDLWNRAIESKEHMAANGSPDYRQQIELSLHTIARAAARTALDNIDSFVGELAVENADGYRTFGEDDIDDWLGAFHQKAYDGQLGSWVSAHFAAMAVDRKSADVLRQLTDGADLGDEDALRQCVRYRLTVMIAGCAPHHVVEPRQPETPSVEPN